MFHQFRREMRATQEHAEALISLASVQGFPFWLALGWLLRGWVLAHQGHVKEGIDQMIQGCSAFRATGAETLQSYAMALLAEAQGTIGEPEAGLTALTEALTAWTKLVHAGTNQHSIASKAHSSSNSLRTSRLKPHPASSKPLP